MFKFFFLGNKKTFGSMGVKAGFHCGPFARIQCSGIVVTFPFIDDVSHMNFSDLSCTFISKRPPPLCVTSFLTYPFVNWEFEIVASCFLSGHFYNRQVLLRVWVRAPKRECWKYKNDSAEIFFQGAKNKSAKKMKAPKRLARISFYYQLKIVIILLPKRPYITYYCLELTLCY